MSEVSLIIRQQFQSINTPLSELVHISNSESKTPPILEVPAAAAVTSAERASATRPFAVDSRFRRASSDRSHPTRSCATVSRIRCCCSHSVHRIDF